MTFRVSHFQLGVQSHHVLSTTTFGVVFLSFASLVISLVWLLEWLFPLGIHNYYLRFGVQSHFCISVFIATILVRHSKPWFGSKFRVIALSFCLAFRDTFLFWHSEPLFIFRLAFRATFSFRHSKPSFIFHLEFEAVVRFPFGVQSHSSSSVQHLEQHSHFDIQSHHIFSLAFRAITSFISAFRAITSFISAFRATSSFGI